MSDIKNRVPAGVPTGGQFAASARAEADVSLTELGYAEPEQGTNCFHACPARSGHTCDDHGSATWSTHPGDLEVRACVEDEDGVISPVPDAEAHFFTLYSADRDGLWMALEDYDTRDEAEAALAETMVTTPVDIYAVRAAVDVVDPHDHKALEALAVASLQHLHGDRLATLEATVRPHGEPIPWNGSGHDHLARTLYAGLVDVTQDVPTQDTMRRLADDVNEAYGEVTNAHVRRDMGHGSDDEIAATTQRAEALRSRMERGDALRERASLRRIAAGRPTIFDVREIEERHAKTRDAARTATLKADAARDGAIGSGRKLDEDPKVAEAAAAEAAAREEFSRQKEFLAAANSAWAALNDKDAR